MTVPTTPTGSLEWAQSLLGRDWEIFWDEEEDAEEGGGGTGEISDGAVDEDETTNPASPTAPTPMDHDANDDDPSTPANNNDHHSSPPKENQASNNVAADDGLAMEVQTPEKSTSGDEKITNTNNDDDDDEGESSEGSIIADWYAGSVKSISGQDESGKFSFEVSFVGEDSVYNMILDPSNVRPSARGWIKRTRALLNFSTTTTTPHGNEQWEEHLPPDTRTLEDQSMVDEIRQAPGNSEVFHEIRLPLMDVAVEIPNKTDLDFIRQLKYLLEVQILLRRRLATIVNHEGSTKSVGGEPNPTESYVENLVKCMEDLVQACTWYCQCWKLYEILFPAGDSSENLDSSEARDLTLDTIIKKFLDAGRVALVGAASINISPTATKRRQPLSPGVRRTKRRRKIMRFGNNQESFLETFDETDFLSTASVDNFAEAFVCLDQRCYLGPLSRMIQSLSHLVIDPILTWKRQARLLLGERDDVLDEQPPLHEDEGSDQEGDDDDDSDRDSVEEMRDSEQERFFTYDHVVSCTQDAEQNLVLSRLDLSETLEKLHEKLGGIESFGSKARGLVCQIMDESNQNGTAQEKDEILNGLKELSIQLRSPDEPMFNIDPLGESSSPLTRAILSDAITIRTWLLDLRHAETVRERFAYVENLASSTAGLPMLPDSLDQNGCGVSGKRDVLLQRVNALQLQYSTHLSFWEELESKIGERVTSGEQGDLMSITGASAALQCLQKVPVISPVEEKIAVRLDILTWKAVAGGEFGEKENSKPGYTTLTELNTSLELILRGKSLTRAALLQDVKPNEEVEKQVCSFSSTDVQAICGPLAESVKTLHSKAFKWQDRAESAISSLRMHGNVAAGSPILVQKLPAMVDLRRIEDLLDECRDLEIGIPGYRAVLDGVYKEATEWADGLHTAIVEEPNPFEKNLEFLDVQRDKRPRGILMDPTRHIFDLVVELLTWHQRVKKSIESLASCAERPSDHCKEAVFESLVVGMVYPLLIEGSDVVELYSKGRATKGQLEASSERCVKTLETLYDLRRTSKFLSRERLEMNPLGSAILTRMVKEELDFADGAPVFMMLWFQWHAVVGEFVAQCDFGESDDEDDESSTSDEAIVLSLAAAKHLKAQEPSLIGRHSPDDMPPKVKTVITTQTSDLKVLYRLIDDAEQVESDVKESLAAAKDMLRGSLEKADSVREHLNKLKELHSNFKSRLDGKLGLSLSLLIEPQLDFHIKLFSWLVRTFPYPMLHLDQASYTAAEPGDSDSNPRIPLHILVSLYERMPCSPEERTGDFALVALRVSELYDAAKKWQEEITTNTMISIRGGKKRTHDENSSIMEMDQVQKLAKNPILAKVAMPREGAVNGILMNSNQFETQLHDFLGKDYDGSNPDRAPYPEGSSLVGKHGEFVLFRLTGSPMYACLLSSVRSISLVADNVLAETPGKAAFDWIRKAVSWIEELNGAVTTESQGGTELGRVMVIPATEAKRILKEGESVFLVIPDDLRRTLSNHGIMVSTNKHDGTLKVVFKKGGAHHSVGGTAIRWCPLLFASLKADVERLDDWERELNTTLKRFNEFFKSTRSDDPQNETNLLKWHEFGEQVSALLEEDVNSLVVNPQKGLVESFRKLLLSIRNYLKKHSNSDLDQRFSRRMYEDGLAVVDDRNLLLDSLLYRRSLPEDPRAPSSLEDPPYAKYQNTFRDTCREYLDRALSKGIKILKMDSHNQSEAANLCLLKAWEIENELFEQFQGELGMNSVAEKYRDKARSLRYNLEKNSTLAVRVLLGDIKSPDLVTMTPDQLASQKAKLDRAKAEEAAKRHTLLTKPDIMKKEPDQGDRDQGNIPAIDDAAAEATTGPKHKTKEEEVVKKEKVNSVNSEALLAPQIDTTPANGMGKDAVGDELKPSSASVPSQKLSQNPPTLESDASDAMVTSESSDLSSLTSLLAKVSKANRPPPPPSLITSLKAPPKTPPPPPPSLIGSFGSQPAQLAQQASTSRARGRRVTNSAGGDRFRIEINKIKATFVVGLALDGEEHTSVNGYLPERLTEKGRLKIDAFEKFLRDKLNGGKWMAIPLKLLTFSDQDAQEYKKFYKEYEISKRIAMFAVGENCKVFLVTPKFHPSASAYGVSLTNRTSTYAVVLTKDRLLD